LFLLIRKISPYTEKDLLLGLFSNRTQAELQREHYILQNLKEDQWAEQGYHEVDLQKDVQVVDVREKLKGEQQQPTTIIDGITKAFVVSLIEEGFGQIRREVDAIFFDKNEAQKYMVLKDGEEREYEPSWFELDVLPLQ